MRFFRSEEKVRACSSSSVEGGGVDGGDPRLVLPDREEAGLLKQRLNWWWWELLAKVSVEISKVKPRFSRAWMTCVLER